ncbi:methyltransferase domain-containing protein [candidate division WOR-3 bacterium]|nr:methyltransferase domain-containing protein [candidate division WOR-3 bacterium]
MMELPAPVITAVLQLLDMPDLDYRTARSYAARLHTLRASLRILSDDFARGVPTESIHSRAYFAYNFPMNFMKARYVIQHLSAFFPALFETDRLKVLDIGCGEGAALLGALYALGTGRRAVFHGYDASHAMVRQARGLIREMIKQDMLPRIRIEHKDLADGILRTKEHYDMIILSNVLVEITQQVNSMRLYIERISKYLSERGIVIVIEPALMFAARRVMELRGHIIAKQKLKVLLPCLHMGPCPLLDLRGGKEWCHQSIPWKPPAYLHILNQELNREIKVLKFSYLVMSPYDHKKPNGSQVISPLLSEKGRKKCYVCSPGRRIELMRLNKHRSPSNSDFDRIEKGNIVLLENGEQKHPDYIRITTDTRIRILSHTPLR